MPQPRRGLSQIEITTMISRGSSVAIRALLFALATVLGRSAIAFTPTFSSRRAAAFVLPQQMTSQSSRAVSPSVSVLFGATTSVDVQHDGGSEPGLQRVPVALEGVPIPFIDIPGNAYIECYADSIATIDGIEYTIGVPCDYAVAICYYNKEKQLVPIELDDKLMEDVFPIAEGIVAEEFGEELVLQRTPQTLTLVGELEDNNDDDDDSSLDDDEASSEEVEVLLTFEHRGKEYNLVRLLDPLLLVGKSDKSVPDNRVLLTPSEADSVMPILESLFLEFHDGPEGLL